MALSKKDLEEISTIVKQSDDAQLSNKVTKIHTILQVIDKRTDELSKLVNDNDKRLDKHDVWISQHNNHHLEKKEIDKQNKIEQSKLSVVVSAVTSILANLPHLLP